MNVHTPVRQLMSANPSSVVQTAPISEVRRLLRASAFHHVPVVSEEGCLVGVISSMDLAEYALDVWVKDAEVVDAEIDASFSLGAVMTHEPTTIEPHESVHKAADLLAEGAYHCLPVVDAAGLLVGMLTSTDVLRFFAVQPS